MPIPTRLQLERFLRIDGWRETRSNDHRRYIKRLGDGSILRTRVSHGRGPAVRSDGAWRDVWRTQLALASEDDFWRALKTGKPVERRGDPAARRPPADAALKPEWLVRALVEDHGVPLGDALAMSEAEARRRLRRRA